MEYPRVNKAYYDSPNGQIHYRYLPSKVEDSSKAPILFLHMTAISGRVYEPLMQRCAAAGYDCFAPDMPGFGGSYDPTSQPSGITFYVEAFMHLPKSLGIEKFHVVGHHTGASVGTEMAALFPDMVLSLTVSGPALLSNEEQVASREKDLVCFNYPVPDGTHFKKTWDYAWTFAPWDTAVELHPHALDAMRAYNGRIQAYTAVFTHDMIKFMSEVKCPVLSLTSEKNMLYPYVAKLKELQPSAVVGSVNGGDWEPLKDVDNFANGLLNFLGSL